MSDQRVIKVSDLNKIIDDKIKGYENTAEEAIQEYGNPDRADVLLGQAEALKDLQITINDPSAIEDVSENIQQTNSVIEAKKIIDNE